MLIGDLLTRSAERHPDKLAIVLGDQKVSYQGLNQAANRIANALIDQGLTKGKNIAIFSANQFDYPAIYFGAAKSGGILAHLSARFSSDELMHVINKTDIGTVFVHIDLLDVLLSVRGNTPELSRIIVFGGEAPDGDGPESLENLASFIGDASPEEPNIEIAETDAFAITYTGGTTGFPKGVVVNHASRIIGCVRAEREFDMRPEDVMCCSTPLFHIAGLFVWFQTSIKIGCTCILMPAWDADVFIDLVENKGVSGAFLVPTQINSVISHPEFTTERVKNWRYCNFGGSPTSVTQLEGMLETLPDVVWQEQYGQSESGNLTVRPPEFNLSKSDSIGRAYSDLDLAIFDREDNPLPVGETGEIVTKGVHNMMEYYKDPHQTEDVFTADGWLKTGDVGYLDEDGFLFLVDRSKDMIISGGENIYPTEIENALYTHPAVNECAVFGIPDDHWGELPAAHVVLESGEPVLEQELIDYCATKIARHKRPRLVKFVESLPKTAVGKIQKNEIRAAYWTDRNRVI
ncbi:MAG: AMP-binding protein [Rhodospirillaceae bacterium]|nr:AMP-binding protein [Rhodospirillaceae bacterium]MBT5938657.1 AMP-binding protein [Rhodospirillaceae bacterium]MBT7267116.1 AMP-binding protein [Rhodospirillaceae bacterium]